MKKCDKCRARRPDVRATRDVYAGGNFLGTRFQASLCNPCWADTRPGTDLRPKSDGGDKP